MSILDLTNEQIGKLGQMLADAGYSIDEIATKMDSLPAKSKKVLDLEEQRNKNLQDRIDLLEAQSAELQAQGEWAESINKINNARHQQELNSLKSQRELGLITAKEYEDRLMDLEARKEIEQVAHSTSQHALKMAQTLTGVSGAWKGTLIGSFFQGDFNSNIQRTAQALKENFSAANMLGSALMKVQVSTMAMVLEADSAFASTNQLTNGTGEYNDMIMDTMANNQTFNVSAKDASESVQALYTQMSNFSNMSKEAQAATVETTAQLKGLGIDVQTTAANFEILNGALGMSAEQAAETQKDFAAMAADLGVSAQKISKDFERNAGTFTAYGNEAVKVFKETAAAAKATGIEMDALLGITTQMDTFEGAARSAGQLNAVLGGGLLNSMELLNATEAERTRMLIGSIEASGKSWTSMSKFEKQAIANAAGVTDMVTANKMFGQSLSEFDAAAAKVEDNAEAQEKLAERAAAAASMQDKLKRIFEQFAVAVGPIINTVHFLLDGLISLNDMTGGMLIPTLIGLATAMMAIQHAAKLQAMWSSIMTMKSIGQAAAEGGLAGAKAALLTATAAQTAAAPAAATGSNVMAKGITALGRAAAKAAPQVLAVLGPIAGIAVAVAAPILLLAVIIWSMKELVLAFMAAPEAILPAILGLAAFIAVAAIGLPILGAAFGGFFLALGAPPVIAAMTSLMPVLPTMAISFGILAVSLWILGKAIQQFVGKGMPQAMALALVSLFAFSTGLKILGPLMRKSFKKVGMYVGILAVALLLLGMALKQWNDVGADDAAMAYVSLWAFGLALKPLAKVIHKGARRVGIAVGILGLGLLLLGMGLQAFNDVGVGAMFMAAVSLLLFGIMLQVIAPEIGKGAFLVGAAVGVLGIGLLLLAKGIQEFMDIGPGMMIGLAIALAVFGWALIPAGVALAFAGTFLLFGALMVTPALLLLALALTPWMDMDFDRLRGLGSALNDMTKGMVWAGIKMAIAGYFMLPGAILLSGALAWLWLGLSPIIDKLPQLASLSTLGQTLNEMTKGMVWAGIKMAIAGYFLLPGAILLSAGLLVLSHGLKMFLEQGVDLEQLSGLGMALFDFAKWLLPAGLLLGYAAIPFFIGALGIGIGLMILNKPLAEFANTLAVLGPVAPSLPAIAAGLATLGFALPGFAFGILMLGIAASLPFFKTGLRTLGRGLMIFGRAVGNIPTEKAEALAKLFEGMAMFTELSGVGKIFRELGWGLWAIAEGLEHMPDGEKVISFSYAADALANLAEASVGVSAEQVVNVQGLADAARSYAWSSRLMRSSDKDALVAALKEVVGLSKSSGGGAGGKTGQDVVLEIDGKEFARAVSAAIDSKHNLPF